MKMEEKLWKSKGRAINMYIGKENKNQAYWSSWEKELLKRKWPWSS
jgi:hypothetical protein